MTRTSTEFPRLEPESSASTNSAMAAAAKILGARRFTSKLSLLLLLYFNYLLADAPPLALVSLSPYRYFVETIGGDTVRVLSVAPAGVNAHAFEPTAKQMQGLIQADIWFILGESFEQRALPALQEKNGQLQVVDLRQNVDLIQGGCCNKEAADLHIWLSPKQAQIQAHTIAQALKARYPVHAALYEQNLSSLLTSLQQLEKEMAQELAPVRGKVLFVLHPSFGYLCRDFQLEQLPLEHEGKDPSPRQLHYTLERAKQAKVHTLFIQPQYSDKAAQLVAQQLHLSLVTINPYQEDYLFMMHTIARTLGAHL